MMNMTNVKLVTKNYTKKQISQPFNR